jgi:hypothetical protein
MSLIVWSEAVGIALALFMGAVVLDMGGKYRIQLMYSATHKGSYEPRLRTKPSIRHAILAAIVILALYMNWNDVKGTASFSFVLLMMMFVTYGVLLYVESVRDLRARETD